MLAGRIARRVGVDRNPLRRRSDRVEAWLTLAMVVMILVAGPLAAWRAADAAYRDSTRALERDQQHRFEVPATLAEDVPVVAQGDDDVWSADAVAQGRAGSPRTARSGRDSCRRHRASTRAPR
jgi:hypothetical protein